MMRLVCNGVALDLIDGQAVTFTKSNPLFAFDSLKCERTAEFSLPATPTNDRVFSLAKVPAYSGEGMRRKFDAQLQIGTVCKNGYLYISSYSGGKYKGVFVTGELVGLQKIKDLGKLPEVVTTSAVTVYGSGVLTPASASSSLWASVDYAHSDRYKKISPSLGVDQLVALGVQQNGLAAVTIPTAGRGLRLFPYLPRTLKEQEITYKSRIVDTSQPQTSAPTSNYNNITANETVFETFDAVVVTTIISATRYYKLRQFKPRQGVKITFPENWPDDLYVVSFPDDGSDGEFLGDRSFTKTWSGHTTTTRTGERLAGRSIDIEVGVPFYFLSEGEYYESQTTTPTGTTRDHGWRPSTSGFECTLTTAGLNETAQVGDVVRAQDALPEVTLVELLKTIAASCGLVLNYTDADGVTFDPLNFSTWPVIDLSDKVTAVGDLKRTFGDYERENVVKCEPSDWVGVGVSQAYTVDNDALKETNDLQTIPFSEGEASGELLYIVDGKEDDGTIICQGVTAISEKKLARLRLPQNAGLQSLCDASTSLEVTVRLSALEFEQIKAKVRILLRGSLYVWTEAKWSKGKATLSLSRL